MKYVKHFDINGVDARQVACIELHGRPNAATEGAVGVLGIDMDSSTRDVYKCVAVNGSIYTWMPFGAQAIVRTSLNGSGGNLDLLLGNNTIYYITGYDTITISLPDDVYMAHLFVTFPTDAEEVGFLLPEGVMISGHDPLTAAAGEHWEVSIDSMGGALFLRKTVLS